MNSFSVEFRLEPEREGAIAVPSAGAAAIVTNLAELQGLKQRTFHRFVVNPTMASSPTRQFDVVPQRRVASRTDEPTNSGKLAPP